MVDGPPASPSSDLEQKLRSAIAERDAWAQDLFESNRFAAELAVARQNLADALVSAETRAAAYADAAVNAAGQERDRAVHQRDDAMIERDRARAAAHDAKAKLDRLKSSTSWRLTRPIRLMLMRLSGRPREEL